VQRLRVPPGDQDISVPLNECVCTDEFRVDVEFVLHRVQGAVSCVLAEGLLDLVRVTGVVPQIVRFIHGERMIVLLCGENEGCDCEVVMTSGFERPDVDCAEEVRLRVFENGVWEVEFASNLGDLPVAAWDG